MLNKDTKARVMLSICNVNVDDDFSHVKEQSVMRDTSHKTVLKKSFGHVYKALSRW